MCLSWIVITIWLRSKGWVSLWTLDVICFAKSINNYKWPLIRAFLSIETNVNCLYQPTQSASLKKYWNLHMPTVSFTEAKVTRENVQISVQYEVECRQIQYLFGSDQTKKKKRKKYTGNHWYAVEKKTSLWIPVPLKTTSPREQTHRKKIFISIDTTSTALFCKYDREATLDPDEHAGWQKKGWTMNNDCNHELKNNIHTYSN